MTPLKLYYYDLETFLKCFLFIGKFEGASDYQVFEMSRRRNQRAELLSWLSYLQNAGVHMVGFNSLGFDYPIIHDLLNSPYTFDEKRAYHLGTQIIQSQGDDRTYNGISLRERIIPQIDLYKINHFDNPSKRTRLKDLQFAMRSESVEDLPFLSDSDLTDEQMDLLIDYGKHDVGETEKFGGKCRHLIEMRQELIDNGVLRGDVLNYSDVKIGTEYLIARIGRQKCFISGSTPRQTPRTEIKFSELVMPKIEFRTEPFQAVLEWFKGQSFFLAQKERPALETTLAGLQFHFGVGGVHASVNDRVYRSSDTHTIIDVDVSGMYVAVAIANGFYPEHLGQDFVTAYKGLQSDRRQYPKGTTMNATLKLGGNGAYGNSNSPYSCFYDPNYMFRVTSNGQLQILQLVELFSLIPGVEIIQANTDGITALVPKALEHFFRFWKNQWESTTGLILEDVTYSYMAIRDVSSYLAVTTKGKIKRKGAYFYPTCEAEYEGVWNKDFSNLTKPKGAEMVMLHGHRPEDVIKLMTDPFDFMLRYKTTGQSKVYIGDKLVPRTLRYYVSTKGEPGKKISPPSGGAELGSWKRKNGIKDAFYNKILSEIPPGAWDERIHTKNKSKNVMREEKIEAGYLIKECNHVSRFDWSDVDYSYYVEQIKKLIIEGTDAKNV